ncbi:amino acid--tRNA ligase-related protein [Microcoleus sp. T2B6]|uniref:amino acid--tRNA ligase-related protein n=1 Tax=Microcoleus sp. T2B6 TaxID=3055424 RepID=UPI002FD09A8A
MFRVYEASGRLDKRQISYRGNNVFEPIEDVQATLFTPDICKKRLQDIIFSEHFRHLHIIDNLVFLATVEYFSSIGAQWCNLPLTTLMISSPGEVYQGKILDYNTDSLPIQIDWFDLNRKVFLSESSQFYLELRLLQENVEMVFSIYNSFRKEKADFSHLSEFQHIEFEGKIGYEENIKIAFDILKFITNKIISSAPKSLKYFLSEDEVEMLSTTFEYRNLARISFKEALHALYVDTSDERYKKFSLEHFGAWEEVRLTQIFNAHIILEEFPLLQTSFYHNELRKDEHGIPLSESADLILMGFREVIGSGVRIQNYEALLEKASIFNLPKDDYYPYLEMRKLNPYQKTSGFGLGWQRYTQWLLKLPYIWDAVHIPRGHILPAP